MGDPGSIEARHDRALEVFDRFNAGSVDAERAARAMERRLGALGTFAVEFIMGDLWSRPQLSRRDRSLVVVSVLMAQARDEELEAHIGIGLNHGLTRTEVDELLLQVAAYAGYPAAMASSRRVDAVWKRLDGTDRVEGRAPATRKSDDQRRADGADVFRTLSGRADLGADAVAALLDGALADVGDLALRFAFGEVWSRSELSRRDRSLSVIAILGALGAEAELSFHAPGGIRHGLTPTEVDEVFVQLIGYAGFPRAVSGLRAARAAIARMPAGS
ncbi:MAG: carboxymuconolactone decarboxylase family protein [Acidimicrobiales bacterium]